MSAFKDQLAKDLGSVWFSDREEFWETHTVNDQPMSIIADSDELRRRSARRVYSSSDSGVYAAVSTSLDWRRGNRDSFHR